MGLRSVLGLLLVAGCAVHAGRVDQLVNIGWYGEACEAAAVLGSPHVDADVVRAHAALAPRFSVRALPVSTWGGEDPAYGRDWVVLEATWEVVATPAPRLDGWVEVVEATEGGLRAWSVCRPETCDSAWVAERVGATTRARSGLWASLGALGKVVALPFALMVDLATSGGRDEAPAVSRDLGPPLTFRLLDGLAPAGRGEAPEGFPPVWSAPECPGAGPCVRRWVATPGQAQAGSQEGVRVQVTWEHEGCAAQAAWVLPLSGGLAGLDAVDRVDLRTVAPVYGVLHGR